MTEEDQQLIDAIFKVRVGNNNPWKRLMEIAMTHAPDDARLALRNIADNDAVITSLVRKLAKG